MFVQKNLRHPYNVLKNEILEHTKYDSWSCPTKSRTRAKEEEDEEKSKKK